MKILGWLTQREQGGGGILKSTLLKFLVETWIL